MTKPNTPTPDQTDATEAAPVDTNKLVAERREKLAAIRAQGVAFPNDFKPADRADKLHAAHDGTEAPDLEAQAVVARVGGRLMLKRVMGKQGPQPLLMALPDYHWPHLRNLALGLWERASIFVTRVGTIILALMVVLWFLSTFPAPPAGATQPAIDYSYAGQLGKALEVVLSPIGFNWQICIALVPGLAAREVAVSALGTVYALSQTGDALEGALTTVIQHSWSLATALSLLTWYVFAPQCLSTLIVVKRETNGWKIPLVMAAYLFALAYGASWVVYRVALHFTG